MDKHISRKVLEKVIVRRCHMCGQLTESHKEQSKCCGCGKAFLPLNYFQKVHDQNNNFDELFASSNELTEEDLVKGIFVLW